VRHCGSMRGSVHVHMVYSVRAKLAVRITARFPDPRRFCPSVGHRDARLSDDCRASGRLGFCRPARAGRSAGLARPTAGCRISPRHPVGAVAGASDRARRRRRDGRPARRRTAAGFSVPPCQDLGPADPVMYLPWTDDVPVVHPPYTCTVRHRITRVRQWSSELP